MGKSSNFLKNAAYLSLAYYSLQYIKKSFSKMPVSGKVVLITGGSRGLGLVLARQLADRNAKVVICATNDEELSIATQEFAEKQQQVLALPCDITDKGQVNKMMHEIREKLGKIDILINNAGVIQVGPVDNMTEEDYEHIMQVHFNGPLHLMNAVIPSMKKAKQGNIVNIVSIGGKVSVPHMLPYSASKFALSGLSEGITSELASDNIKVTTVYPGLMRTGSPRNIDVKGDYNEEYKWFKIADSLPFLSMDAEKAASKIIDAIRTGEKTITLGLPAKIQEILHGVAPGLSISLMEIVESFLPETKPGGQEKKKGYETEPDIAANYTEKTDQAAVENNEIR